MRVDPGDGCWWEPKDAVVVAGGRGGIGDACTTCWTFVNSVASPESAERYARDRPELRAEVISIPEAVEAGRIGDLFEETVT